MGGGGTKSGMLFRRREVPQRGFGDGASSLKRCLGLTDVVFFGVGKMVGAGILVLIGAAARRAGPAVVLSYVVSAAAVLCSVLCYADFVAQVPLAGGAYSFVYASLGEIIAFHVGWLLVFEYACGAAALSRGWTEYVYALMSQCGIPKHISEWVEGTSIGGHIEVNVLAFAYIACLFFVVATGIQQSSKFNQCVTCIKLACLAMVVVVGLMHADSRNWGTGWQGFAPNGVEGVISAAIVVFYSYIGFDAVATIAEEVKDPSFAVPLGMLASVGIAVIVYVLVCVSVTLMVPANQLEMEAPLAGAFRSVGHNWMAVIISLAAITGMPSGTMLNLTSQARTWMTLSRDGLIPEFFGYIHPTTQTPLQATIVAGTFAALLATFLRFEVLVSLISAGTLFALICVNLGHIARRHLDQLMPIPWLNLGLYVTCSGASTWCLSGSATLVADPTWKLASLIEILVGIGLTLASLCIGAVLWWQCPASPCVVSETIPIRVGALVPLLGTWFCLVMLSQTAFVTCLWPLLSWAAIGLFIYSTYGCRHSALNQGMEPLCVIETAPPLYKAVP